MATVTLRYWAAAKEAAGIAEETITAETLAEALAAARGQAGHGERGAQAGREARLHEIFARSSFLIDGTPVGTRAPETVTLGEAAVIEVLPPFAGG